MDFEATLEEIMWKVSQHKRGLFGEARLQEYITVLLEEMEKA